MGYKRCTKCGYHAPLKAMYCPSCNNKLEHPMMIVFAIIFVLVLVGAFLKDDNSSNSKNENISNEVLQYEKISADELMNELENNAALAKEKYKDKYLIITGKLGNIDADLKYITVYPLNKQYNIVGIHCSIKNESIKTKVKQLIKNQEVTVKGKITDVGEILGYYFSLTDIES